MAEQWCWAEDREKVRLGFLCTLSVEYCPGPKSRACQSRTQIALGWEMDGSSRRTLLSFGDS
jgi:hypothetical protein